MFIANNILHNDINIISPKFELIMRNIIESFKDWRSNQKMQQTRFAHLAEAASKTKVFIYNGILYSGLLDKSQIGASANGLLHYCYEVCFGFSRIMDELFKIVVYIF